MRKNIRVKPSKGASAAGFAVGVVLILLGISVVIPGAGTFGILWTLVAGIITVFHGLNAFSDKGADSSEIVIEDRDVPADGVPAPGSTEQRLAELKRLYDQRLITREEYEAQRKEIISQI